MNTATPAKLVAIVSSLDAEHIACRNQGFIPHDAWSRFVGACRHAGLTYNKALKTNMGPIESLGALTTALREASFEVALDTQLSTKLRAELDVVKDQIARIREIADEVEATLAPRGLTLWKFQREGVGWLRLRQSGLLGDDPGLGKTIQILMAILAGTPIVIVCPAVAKGVWARETFKWRPDFYSTVLKGRSSFRWPRRGQIVVTNYDILPENRPADDPLPGTLIVADEAHNLKGAGTNRRKRFRALVRAVKANEGRVWLATGSPLLNRAKELWNVLEVADLGTEAFGSWPVFERLMADANGNPNASPAIAAKLRKVMLRRHRTDVLPDLPTKVWSEIPVDSIDDATQKLCDGFLDAMRKAGVDFESASDAAVETWINGPGFTQMSRVRAALATAKIPVMLSVVEQFEENGEPLVVFSDHRAPIDTLADRPGWAVITGDTPPAERTRIEDRFQRGELKGVGGTIKAAGVAITLVRSHQALMVDMNWVPDLNRQAEDRICRIGQDRGVIITRLVASHVVDQKLTERLHQKQMLIDATVNASAVTIATKGLEEEATALASAIEGTTTIAAPKTRVKRHAASSAEVVSVAIVAKLANDQHFDEIDSAYGRHLAGRLAEGDGLSEDDWQVAVGFMRKYTPSGEVQTSVADLAPPF